MFETWGEPGNEGVCKWGLCSDPWRMLHKAQRYTASRPRVIVKKKKAKETN